MYYNYQKSIKQYEEPNKLGKFFGKTVPKKKKKNKGQWFAMDSSQISCGGKTFVELWCLYGSSRKLVTIQRNIKT